MTLMPAVALRKTEPCKGLPGFEAVQGATLSGDRRAGAVRG
jgi:hypothetical protein